MPKRNPPDPRYQKLSKEAAKQLIAEDTGALVGFLFSREMENRGARDRITEGYPEAPKYKKGGKFNPKYTRGSADVSKRKKLMSEISNIYKQHRGTKAKRQKKGFPPAVAARLKRLMAQRDKI